MTSIVHASLQHPNGFHLIADVTFIKKLSGIGVKSLCHSLDVFLCVISHFGRSFTDMCKIVCDKLIACGYTHLVCCLHLELVHGLTSLGNVELIAVIAGHMIHLSFCLILSLVEVTRVV